MSEEEKSQSEELAKIKDLTTSSREINIVVKVVSKSEVRNVTGRDYSVHRVADALVGDETGSLYLTLWDDNIDKVQIGKMYSLRDGYVNLFRGHLRLNIGKYGVLQEIEGDFGVDESNDVSAKSFEEPRRRDRGFAFGSVY